MKIKAYPKQKYALNLLGLLTVIFLITACGGGNSSDSDPNPTPEITLATGSNHSCALLTNGSVKCWGSNLVGQLGLEDTEDRGDQPNEMGDDLDAVNLGTGRSAKAIATGSFHTCALLDNNTVKCWGSNLVGQLGLEDTEDRGDGDQPNEMGDDLDAVNLGTGRSAKAITAGYDHNCALLDNNSVKCWGNNSYGQLGLEDTEDRGDQPNEMGDNLDAVNLGAGRTAKTIVSRVNHTCALLDDNSVKCWGNNSYGQLGLGDTNHRGDAISEMGNSLPTVDLGNGRSAIALATGSFHSCALLDNNSVKCWGRNQTGQLGLENTLDQGDQPDEMETLPTVNLGSGRSAKAIALGKGHSCALLDNNSLKCWGDNGDGRLGLGDTLVRGNSTNQMGDDLEEVNLGMGLSVKGIVSGDTHNCALLNNNAIKCWGYNANGQLGLGDTLERGSQPVDMGDKLPEVDLGSYYLEL